MPIDYTGTSAGLFVRLGKLINAGQEHRAAQNALVTHIEETMGKYTSTSIDRTEYLGTMAGDRETIADASGRAAQDAVREAMERTIIEQVDDELSPGLEPSKTIDNALRRLTIDMLAQSQAIGTTSISFSAVTNASTTFDGTIIIGENRKFDNGGAKKPSATPNDTILAETLTARCVKDARDGSMILGNERFEVAGDNAVDRLDRRWPEGSGAILRLNATCSDIDSNSGTGQNMLTNSGFERVDGTPFPLDWTAAFGTIGTSLTSSTTSYRGARSVAFTGDGSSGRGIRQTMGVGPRAKIRTNTAYAISARIRANSGTLTAGSISFELTDSLGSQITGCFVTRNFNSGTGGTNLGTTWEHVRATFTTPLNLPSEVRFLIDTNVALANGAVLLIDEVILAPLHEIYPGGPGCIVVPGTANFELGDQMRVAVTKTAAEWAEELDRYLHLGPRGILFPTGTGTNETITTTLIA